MEGYSPDSPNAPEKKGESKTDTKSSKESLLKLGGKTLETGNKNEAAHKIADSSLWEKLIPKSGEKKAEQPPTKDTERLDGKPEIAELPAEAAVERLNSDEQREVVRDRATERRSEIQAEATEDKDPAEVAADAASLKFYEQLAENRDSVPEIMTELPTDVAEELEDEPDEALEVAEPAHAPEVAETIDQSESAELAPEAPAELEHDQAINLNQEKPKDEEPTPTPASSQPAAGGAGTPNQPPTPPSPPTGPANPNFNPFTAGGGGANPDTAPATTIENNYYEDNGGAYMLAGGILGYMLGRRRGRIKTEKKLKAVSRNLERQIKQTHERIDRQELTIREQARERFNQTRGTETTTARSEQRVRPEVAERQKAEKLIATPAEITAVGVTAEQVQKMEHHELLAAVEKIDIDGTNLRQIFEAKQITEPGLRRLTQEYLRGGDVRHALQYERQVKEMQYERDPQMRDRLAASYAEIDAARPQSAQEALSALLAQDAAPSPQVVRAAQQAAADEAKAAQKPHNQVLISAWVALIVVLVIIIAVLAMH
jgi:hypothetical protein